MLDLLFVLISSALSDFTNLYKGTALLILAMTALSYLSLIFAFSLIFVFPSFSFLWLPSIVLFLISCLAN